MSVTLESLQEEIKQLTVDIMRLNRQQQSRRGPEGLPGKDSTVAGPKGDVGPMGTVSREQAIIMFREVVNDIFKDEISRNRLKEVIDGVIAEIKFRLVRKSPAELAQEKN